MQDLLQYCKTERQREAVEAWIECGSQSKAADKLGLKKRSYEQVLQRVRGNRDNERYSEHLPSGHSVKGVSRLVNRVTGETQLEWIKTDRSKVDPTEAVRAALDVLRDDAPRYIPSSPIVQPESSQSFLNAFIITDYHFGMYAWAEETKGENWDINKAESLLVNWFTTAIKQAPPAKTAIFCNLGDFLHFDSALAAVTPTSGHPLDADSRLQKIIRVVLQTIRAVVNKLLAKHEKVILIMAEGNHDISSSAWLREVLAMYYENEPRIVVDTNPDPYYCHEHGETSLFFHHGHKKKLAALDSVMASKFRDVFGRTKNSYCHTGHYHHSVKLESNLMILEQHRTLAAPDAHSSRGGWLSGREAQVITYHKDFGEVGRVIINPDMVNKTMR